MTHDRPASPEDCAYLHPRTLAYCLAPSVVVVVTGSERGACRAHVEQVTRKATEDYTATASVVPVATWRL